MNISSRTVFLSILTSTIAVSLFSRTIGNPAQPLPEENESFETIRRNNKTYVDKTPFLTTLLWSNGTLFCLTRPTRFGKSTFLQMVRKFFLGQDNLFENLEIHANGNGENGTWLKYPVIYLDFSSSKYVTINTETEFTTRLSDELKNIAQSYGVATIDAPIRIGSLVDELRKIINLPVVILIDEYDAPVKHANNSELAKGINKLLVTLFSEIKASSANLKFAFVTGVLRLTSMNEWSGLNNFVDLTDNEDFAAAFGFSKLDINTYFGQHINDFMKKENTTRKDIMKNLIEWYGGYKFTLRDNSRLLSPTAVSKCLHNQTFSNVWYGDDIIRHLVDTFLHQRRLMAMEDFDNFTVKANDLFQNYEYDRVGQDVPWHILLLFTGYLTINSYDQENGTCLLRFTNREMMETLSNQVCSYVVSEKKFISELPEWTRPVKESMREGDIHSLMGNLSRFDFPILDLSKTEEIRGLGRMRTLLQIFNGAGIQYKLGVENWHFFHIDILTLEFPINYVIEIRPLQQAMEGMLRLCNFTQFHQDHFKKAIDFLDEVYLISMDFTIWGTDKLGDWICVPYRHGDLIFNETQASNNFVRDSIIYRFRNYKRMTA